MMNNHKRIMAELHNQPWLISRAGMEQICAIADGGGDIEAVLAKRGDRPKDTSRLEIRDRVAVLSVTGPIFRYANLFTEISGATSVAQSALDFRAALDNARVQAIVMNLDTPGGQVNGIHEFAASIRRADAVKPVYAYVGNLAASAGYWLAAACGKIMIDPTAMLGSIGVVISYYKKNGQSSLVEVTNDDSPHKRLDPDSEAGQAAVRKAANDLARVFIDSVAEYRGVSRETVINDFGRGGMLIGSEAIDAGMADGFSNLEAMIEDINNQQVPRSRRPAAVTTNLLEDSPMKKDELRAKYPEACQEIYNDGVAAGEKNKQGDIDAANSAKDQAVTAEKDRIMGLMAVQSGEENAKKFQSLVDSGLTVDQYKAVKGLEPEQPAPAVPSKGQEMTAEMLEAIKQAGAENPGAADGSAQEGDKDFDTLVADYMACNKDCSKATAMQKVRAANPEAHKTWLEKQQVH